jgi:hypothetical protein
MDRAQQETPTERSFVTDQEMQKIKDIVDKSETYIKLIN